RWSSAVGRRPKARTVWVGHSCPTKAPAKAGAFCCLRSALGGDERLLQQKCCGVGEGQIVRDALKVSVQLLLLNADGFEQQRFAVFFYLHVGHSPIARREFSAFYGKAAPLLEMTKESKTNFHIFKELPLYAKKPVLPCVNPNAPRHF